MEWISKNWIEEDNRFSPKRKVDNKLSWKIHHLIGSFNSVKMNKTVEYESLGECLFYYFLELDHSVMRYYVQPVEVKFRSLKNDGDIKEWVHVPDVLVFRNGSTPFLYQIKENPNTTSKHELINKKCAEYANQEGWIYKVIYPKQMPKTILRNINFLYASLKKRKWFDDWIPIVVMRLKYFKTLTILDLANSFNPQISPLYILPVIYHLIAKGVFSANIYQEIDEYSVISMGSLFEQLSGFVIEEGEGIEAK
jgi:hypothetical protein